MSQTPQNSPAPEAGSRIRLLSENLANMIAAGEVVERPASVVKELVENSLDAGAKRILVEIGVGGRKLIRVIDDGAGMSPDDALLCLERHATSKIATQTDLFSLSTLGFRGEALPAIASVCRLNLRTAQRGAPAGTRIQVEGGKIKEVSEEAHPPGTEVEVADLFYNTPGRRKFLRSPETELTHIVEGLTRLALPRQGVFFRLRHEGKTLLQVPGEADFPQRVASLLGPDAASGLVELDWEGRHFRLKGFLSGPETTRSSTSHFFVYCNGRSLRDRLITHAVNTGYRGHILKGRYPIVILLIEIDPELVDVNVHPTKSEVRFRKPSGVYEGVVNAINTTLRRRFGAPGDPFAGPWLNREEKVAAIPDPVAKESARPEETATPIPSPTAAASLFHTPSPPTTRNIPLDEQAEDGGEPAGTVPAEPLEEGAFSRLAIVGQIFNNYIVCETRENKGMMVVIDAHAAHERILFEKLKAEYRDSSIAVQGQLIPLNLELRRVETAALLKAMGALSKVGIKIEHFGQNTFRIVGVPSILSGGEAEAVVRECIERTLETGHNASPDHVADDFLSVLACHSAVRSGQELTVSQMREILRGMDRIPGSGSCPHGRPTVWSVSLHEIEKRFKRR